MTTREEAADRAEQIRLGLQQTGVLYAKAIEDRDWQTLGYMSVTQWARCEFGPDRFSAERRKEIVGLLTDAGLAQREIAQAVGVSQPTVMRDQQSRDTSESPEQPRVSTGETPPQASDGSPGDQGLNVPTAETPTAPAAPRSPRQQAAREREARRRGPAHRSNGGNAQAARGRPSDRDLSHQMQERKRLTEVICDRAVRNITAALDPESELGQQLDYLCENASLLTQLSKLKLARVLNELAETASNHHDRILGLERTESA